MRETVIKSKDLSVLCKNIHFKKGQRVKPLNRRQAEFVRKADKIIENHDIGAEADAGFDGGEFSGPSHHDAEQRELESLADEYGIHGEEYGELMNPIFCEECGDNGCSACFTEKLDGKTILDWHLKLGNIWSASDGTLIGLASDGVEVIMQLSDATSGYLVDHPDPEDW